MRSREFILLLVAVLCLRAVAAEQPPQFSSDDVLILMTGEPNDPNRPIVPPAEDPNRLWDPARHLTATWQSISVNMTSQLYNPAVQSHQAAAPQWSLSLRTRLDVLDSNGLVGLSQTTGSAQAFDQDGREVSSSPAPSSSLSRWYIQPHYVSMPTGPNHELVTTMHPNMFSVSLPMDPNAHYPSVLSRVQWSINVLVANEFKTVDVPFKASEKWIELAPGLEILVEKATTEAGKYEYTIKIKENESQADYLSGGSVHLWREEKPPAALVLDMSILNAAGKAVTSGSSSFQGSGSYHGISSGGVLTGTTTGNGNCATCGNATTIRYTLALNAYEKEIRFVLTDVPVPHF